MKTKIASIFLLTCLLSGGALAQRAELPQNLRQQEETKLRFAASQHEIISILLHEERYESVLEEFQKILDLSFVGENEALVVEEAWLIAEYLREAGQFEVAHQVVDRTLSEVGSVQNRFLLMMLKGKVLREEGRLSEALDVYRQAQELKN
jgi:tetratricopeptide (TPR) repeat protein